MKKDNWFTKRSKEIIRGFKWSGVTECNTVGFPITSNVKTYEVSLTLNVTTSGGEISARRIFSNIVKSDPNHPFLNLKVNAPRPTKRNKLDK